MSSINLKKIISRFNIIGHPADIIPFGSGHINDTYLVKNADRSAPDYILQRINHHVFKNVPGLMFNFKLVTEHIKSKLLARGSYSIDTESVTLVATPTGAYFFKNDDGSYWRVSLFIPDTRSYDVVSTPQQAYQGGRGFGRFQAMLADMDPKILTDTIPNFHNIINRLEKLEDAIKTDRFHRAGKVQPELAFAQQRSDAMSTIIRLGQEGELPLRVTHNDTKFNNLLLNQADEAQCVIDLDTVMAGYAAYDFGDAVRTIINIAAEDEADLDKIDINLELFEAFTRGFLLETASTLTPKEVESLLWGALLLPYMQGVRFLTDYLEGDHYFKIKFPEHNLQRTRAQFRLVSKLENNRDKLNLIINNMAQAVQQGRSVAV